VRRTLVMLCVVACHREHRPHATGSFAFDTGAIKGDPALFFATEAEIVRGRRILEIANQRLGTPAPAPDVHVDAARRGNSAVFDVTVYADDPDVAIRTCNAVIETYVESRLAAKQQALMARIEALDDAGSDAGSDAAAKRDALIVEQHTHANDARLLDPCAQR
jgi:hypothetical protein